MRRIQDNLATSSQLCTVVLLIFQQHATEKQYQYVILSRPPSAVYNFLVQQWMGYKAAVAAAAGASAGVGTTEATLMNRALTLLSKIMPWAGEKSMGEEPNDFLPVSDARQTEHGLMGVMFYRVRGAMLLLSFDVVCVALCRREHGALGVVLSR